MALVSGPSGLARYQTSQTGIEYDVLFAVLHEVVALVSGESWMIF